MDFAAFIFQLDNWLWATPLIAVVFVGALIYCFAIKWGNITKFKLQWKLLVSGGGSQEGISPFETFCSVVAYRVAVGNIGGVMLAIMYGGPGAVFWMPVTALVTSAIAYAENSLGQIYKVRMDGQYRGGPYFYMQAAFPNAFGKILAAIFALFCTIGVPLFCCGASANNIAQAMNLSFGFNQAIVGAVIAVLLFLVISGGVRRIASVATILVPFMTIGYLIITVIVLIGHASAVPSAVSTIITSAFNVHSMFGGMMGAAFSYGVKRAVNSSGSGFGETPPTAAAAETPHPATQGLVNAFSVYIDVAVCICSGLMAVVSDCFNVLGDDGVTYKYIGAGSDQMQAMADSGTANVIWVQEAANSVLPMLGGAVIAIALTCFAFSTCVAYYYEGESGLAYLCRNLNPAIRKKLIWFIRILMPIMFFVWANVTAATAWALNEVMFGFMAWMNILTLLYLLPKVKKIYDDYFAQRKAGVKEPYFNPEKLGMKGQGMDLWMDINKDRIAADAAKGK